MGMLSSQEIIFTTIYKMSIFAKKGGGLTPHFRFRRPMEYHIFSYCSTFEILFVLMTYKHNLFTNSIELWIDEITSPSAYSRIREALKLACFREIAPVWATADRIEILDIFAIWAVASF